MAMQGLVAETVRATGFLTRYRLPSRYFEGHDGRLGKAAAMFPLAGLAAAAPSASVALLLTLTGTNPALIALIVLGLMVWITGALHEDGLADTADGFGAGGPRERMLAIMKDSRIGSYGVLALLFSAALRGVSLTIIIAVLPPLGSAAVIMGIAALSRAAMVWHWNALPPARENGVAARAGMPKRGATEVALLSGLVLFAVAAFLSAGLVATLVSLALTAASILFMTSLSRRKIGGHTGDTIGAVQQVAEITLLGGLALAL